VLGYTNANSDYNGAVTKFVSEYYDNGRLLKIDYDRLINDGLDTIGPLLDWTTRALSGSGITKGTGNSG